MYLFCIVTSIFHLPPTHVHPTNCSCLVARGIYFHPRIHRLLQIYEKIKKQHRACFGKELVHQFFMCSIRNKNHKTIWAD
jgi:hypothetical protein